MIIDGRLLFSNRQAIAGVTALSTNSIDLGRTPSTNEDTPQTFPVRSLAEAGKLMLDVRIITLVGGGALRFELVTDDAAAFGTPVVRLDSGVILAASAPSGSRFILPVPATVNFERFVRLNYIVPAGTTYTITAGLTLDSANWHGHPDAIN